MKFMFFLLAVSCFAFTHSLPSDYGELPVHPGVGGFFRGPNSETIIKGPDGSVITAEAQGGEVQTKLDVQPIVVPEQPALVAAPIPAVSHATVALESVQPVAVPVQTVVQPVAPLAVAAPVAIAPVALAVEEPHIIETELVDAPDVEPDQSSDLQGPSGRILTKGSKSIVSGPASTTISEPVKKIPLIPAVPVAVSVATPLVPAPVNTGLIAAPLATVTAGSVLANGLTLEAHAAPGLAVASIETPANAITKSLLGQGSLATINDAVPVISSASSNGVLGASLGSSTVAPILSSTLLPQVASVTPLLPSSLVTKQILAQPVLASTPAPILQPTVPLSYGHRQIAPAGLNQVPLNRQLIPGPQILDQSLVSNQLIAPGTALKGNGAPIGDPVAVQAQVDLQRQLLLHQIPSQNIIPPEIALHGNIQQINDAVSLQAQAVGLSSTAAPPAYAANALNIDGKLGQVDLRAQPLLRETRPLLEGLAKYNIDPSQINLANVPLSEVQPLGLGQAGLVKGAAPVTSDISEAVWNRYGRQLKAKL